MNYTTIMDDNEVKQNILKCSRCGLCQGVCPIYEEIKNENSTARGKLMQIWGIKKGDLKLNRKILQSLDLCLNCEKCKLNCPSGVDTTGVFHSEKKLPLSGKILTSDFIFKLKLSSLNFFSFFKKTPQYDKNSKILYFEGCIAKELKNKFEISGIKVKNGNFLCCGMPYLTKGRADIYEKIVEHNERIIDKSEMVIFDCATCLSAVKDYPFKNPKNREKLVFYTDFYKDFNLQFKKNLKVTYHMPCHLKSAGKNLEEIEKILNSIKNVNYTRLENPQNCCGFGGDFFIRHPKIAFSLSIKKGLDIINTKADVVLTSCPTCLWSLNFSLFVCKILYGYKKIPTTLDMSEFLNKCEIITKNLPRSETQKNIEKELVKM